MASPSPNSGNGSHTHGLGISSEQWAWQLVYEAYTELDRDDLIADFEQILDTQVDKDVELHMSLEADLEMLNSLSVRYALSNAKLTLPQNSNGQTILTVMRLVHLNGPGYEAGSNSGGDEPTMKWALWFLTDAAFKDMLQGIASRSWAPGLNGDGHVAFVRHYNKDLNMLQQVFAIAANVVVPMVAIDTIAGQEQNVTRTHVLGRLQVSRKILDEFFPLDIALDDLSTENFQDFLRELEAKEVKIRQVWADLKAADHFLTTIEGAMKDTNPLRCAASRLNRTHCWYAFKRLRAQLTTPGLMGQFEIPDTTSPTPLNPPISNTDDEGCIICQEDIDYFAPEQADFNFVKLPGTTCPCCRKTLHLECMYSWIRSHVKTNLKATCPHCRTRLTEEYLTHVLQQRTIQVGSL